MKILIAGDFYDPAHKADLSNLQTVIDDADYSIVNYESPVALHDSRPIEKHGPNLKSTAESIKMLREAGFDALTLANNHIKDYGGEGVLNTIDVARQNDLDIVGAGDNKDSAAKILYKLINGETLALINCCEHEFSIVDDASAGANPLNPIAQFYSIQEARNNADYVLVIVHGGHEQYNLPSPRMKQTYRFFVDAGADAVVNHHQHCYSGYEVYNGKPIYYGLGNFYFPGSDAQNFGWNEGFCLCLDFNKSGVAHRRYPYQQCRDGKDFNLIENTTDFEASIEALNKVIEDEKLLTEAFDKESRKFSKSIDLLLSPYDNKYLRVLCYRGLLPSFVSNKKKLAIRNFVDCEAHRDRISHILSIKK